MKPDLKGLPGGLQLGGIEMRCISTFSKVGKIERITLGRDYSVKFILRDKVLITNDIAKPHFVDRINFVPKTWVDEISKR